MPVLQVAGGTAITSKKNWPTARLRLLAACVATAGLAVDFGTKVLAIAALDPAHPVPILGGLVVFRLTRNSGAAFSMGEGFTLGLTIIAIIALVGVVGWLLPRVRHVGWAVGTGLLLAGIAGNLADRLFREPSPFHGHVVDFIQLPYFAIINVADICITAAAVVIIWLTIFTQVSPAGTRYKDASDVPKESVVQEASDVQDARG